MTKSQSNLLWRVTGLSFWRPDASGDRKSPTVPQASELIAKIMQAVESKQLDRGPLFDIAIEEIRHYFPEFSGPIGWRGGSGKRTGEKGKGTGGEKSDGRTDGRADGDEDGDKEDGKEDGGEKDEKKDAKEDAKEDKEHPFKAGDIIRVVNGGYGVTKPGTIMKVRDTSGRMSNKSFSYHGEVIEINGSTIQAGEIFGFGYHDVENMEKIDPKKHQEEKEKEQREKEEKEKKEREEQEKKEQSKKQREKDEKKRRAKEKAMTPKEKLIALWLAGKGMEKRLNNFWLHGPAGCGKTTITKDIADELGVQYYILSCGAGTYASDVKGKIYPNEKISALMEVAQVPSVICLDEMPTLEDDIAALLHPLLASNPMIETATGFITRHTDCLIIATGNTIGEEEDEQYKANKGLDGATRDRFKGGRIPVNYDPNYEAQFDADIVAYANMLRQVIKANHLQKIVSTRALQACTIVKKAGLSWRDAMVDDWTDDEKAMIPDEER